MDLTLESGLILLCPLPNELIVQSVYFLFVFIYLFIFRLFVLSSIPVAST